MVAKFEQTTIFRNSQFTKFYPTIMGQLF